jgi:hypothetical protein
MKLSTELRAKGLSVVLVDFREDPDTVKRTVAERGYITPVLIDRNGDTAGRSYGVFGTPSVYFIDRQSRLVGRAIGPRDWESEPMRRFLDALLQPTSGR